MNEPKDAAPLNADDAIAADGRQAANTVRPRAPGRRPYQTGTPEYVKALNRRLILDLTRRWQPVSRARLSDLSGLNKSTVTSIVRDLLDEGLVQEAGTDPSTGGRPGIQLVLNPRRFQVVAVEIGVTTSHLLLTDINGAAWLRESMPTPAAPADMIAAVRAFVRRAAAAAGGLQAIVLSVPGLVDGEAGTLLMAPNLGWREVPLAKALEDLGPRVLVENEAKLAALAEMWYGRLRDEDSPDFGYVSVTEGLGVGLVFHGTLYRGAGGHAGEYGHTTLNDNGHLCACGNRGCWETYASERAAVQAYQALVGGPAVQPVSFETLVSRGLEGDPLACRVLEEVGRYLGIGIANLVNGLSLPHVIVGGRVRRAWPVLAPRLEKELQRRTLSPNRVTVMPSELEQASLAGCIVLAVQPEFATQVVA